ncbi:hypothetical protein M4578_00400 [Salipiger sp. P9]|uniref:hypothetical protein n=1 Tax=Salipiger pentaromativorans TaxID=2943193 RepID=UPI0021583CF8|nr:hypothetical protein [Salipiger pentaromativorans]MCR8546269.1 hypothetical protein [Salipiger pentaromativorans]
MGGYGMGGGGLIWLIVLGVLVVVPFWRLLPKFGIPAWVALVSIIPLGALILLWIMAFKDKTSGGIA